MKKIYYEKVGRRYKPIAEYDNEFLDSFPKGNHLVMVYPGGSCRRFNIDPALAPMIAAGRVAEDSMYDAIHQAAKMHPGRQSNKPLTAEQHEAWKKFVEVMGESGHYVHYASVHDIAEAGIKAMEREAEKLMKHEAVRNAYEQFMMVCKLVAEDSNA